jgi:hypothetical protein
VGDPRGTSTMILPSYRRLLTTPMPSGPTDAENTAAAASTTRSTHPRHRQPLSHSKTTPTTPPPLQAGPTQLQAPQHGHSRPREFSWRTWQEGGPRRQSQVERPNVESFDSAGGVERPNARSNDQTLDRRTQREVGRPNVRSMDPERGRKTWRTA